MRETQDSYNADLKPENDNIVVNNSTIYSNFFTLLFVVIQRIINLKKQLLVDLEKAATIDELTQLNNRRGFMNFVNLEISRLKRSRSDYAIRAI